MLESRFPGVNLWRVIPRPPRASVILEDFKKYEAEFKELHEACQRPFARYDIDYKRLFDGEYQINFMSCRALAQSLALQSSAALVFNDSETALQNIRSTLALSRISRSQPTLVGPMIRVAIAGLVTQTVWEGLASHRWTENQLTELQNQLSSFGLLSDVAFGLRTVRAHECNALENHSRKELSTNHIYLSIAPSSWEDRVQQAVICACPRGWLYQNERVCARAIQDTLESMDLKAQQFSEAKLNAANNAVAKVFRPFSYFETRFQKALQTTVRNQTDVNQAIIACTLERHRLAHGEYPETLEALVPQFAGKLPHDIISGQPLKYRRESQEHFILYSIGFDEKDDGGSPATTYYGPGDWVWRYPKM